MADRAEQHAGEATAAVGSDHQQVGVGGFPQQRLTTIGDRVIGDGVRPVTGPWLMVAS